MKGFWLFFLKKQSFSYLVLAILILLGISSLISIPKESSPEVEVPVAVVTTTYAGAPAEDIEKLITVKIEDQLNASLDDVKKITSTSREAVSSVVVEFEASADIDESVDSTKEEVDKVIPELPSAADDPVVIQIDFVDQPVIEFSVTSELPLLEFISLSEDVQDEIKKISGVSKVNVNGVRSREVQVIVEREALSTFGISLDQIISAVRASNATIPVGSITQDGIQYAVKFEGDIENPLEIRNIPIISNNGVPIYVRDVAFVSDGVSDATSFSRLSTDGQPARQSANFSVFNQTGGDVTRTTQAVRDRLEELQEDILKGEEVLVSLDSGELVEEDLTTLSFTALQTVMLVMVVLFLTLGWRDSLIAGSAIPLSFLISFIFLEASGNTINFVSLFSLILAVGILVDSSIVLTEGIHTNIRAGLKRREAAYKAIQELNWPIIAGTMTTIAVFFPLFFLSGVTGEFIASIPFTVISVLISSLFVALAIVPLFAVRFLEDHGAERSRLGEKRKVLTDRFRAWYRRQLRKIIGIQKQEKRFIRVMVVLLIISLALPFTGLIKVIFFDSEDSEFLFIDVETKEGSSLVQNDLATREVENILYRMSEIDSFVTTIGSLSSFTAGTQGNKYSNISVVLKEKDRRPSAEIATELRYVFARELPNTIVKVTELSGGPPTGAPIVATFSGDDFDDLDQAIHTATQLLEKIEGVRDVETTLAEDAIDFVITVDREKVTEVGLNPTVVASTLRTAVFGSTATTIRADEEDIDVEVRLALNSEFADISRSPQTTIDTLNSIQIDTPNGPVFVGSLIDVSLKRANPVINREDLTRVAKIEASVEEGFNAGELNATFRRGLAQAELPEGVAYDFGGGEAEEIQQSFLEMGFSLIYGLLLVFAILVLQFNSFRQSFMILSITPFILIGIFVGLLLTAQPISFPSIMGFIAIAGIAVNNSIILVDVMNRLKRNNPEMSTTDIVLAGAEQRLRPIVLTTLTTVIGIAPLTYASALWSPLAWSIIFGLTFTVVLTLILIPILYHRRLVKERAQNTDHTAHLVQ